MKAAANGHYDIVNALLQANADATLLARNGMNALAYAAATARHPENYDIDLAVACWGNDSLEHTDL